MIRSLNNKNHPSPNMYNSYYYYFNSPLTATELKHAEKIKILQEQIDLLKTDNELLRTINKAQLAGNSEQAEQAEQSEESDQGTQKAEYVQGVNCQVLI